MKNDKGERLFTVERLVIDGKLYSKDNKEDDKEKSIWASSPEEAASKITNKKGRRISGASIIEYFGGKGLVKNFIELSAVVRISNEDIRRMRYFIELIG